MTPDLGSYPVASVRFEVDDPKREFWLNCEVGPATDLDHARTFGNPQRAVSAKKLAVGDRFSGSNDAGSAWLTCMCRQYDPELADYFRSRGFIPSAGALGGGTQFDENGARDMLKDLRKELDRLRKHECKLGDCNSTEELYPWDQLIDLALKRRIPWVGDIAKEMAR